MKLLKLLGMAILGLGLVVAFDDCPRQCTCTQSSFSGSRAHCTVLDTQVQSFPSDMVHLVIENYQEERLHSKIFADLGLHGLLTLSLTNGSLKYVNKDAFDGLTYLEYLDLSNNKIESLDPHTFENIRLKKLNMNGNPLLMYDPQAPKDKRHFLYADSLVELTLANTKISKFEDVQALSKLYGLTFLDLSDNRLTELKNETFSTLSNLQVINLSNNLIKHIDRDTFANLDELRILNVRGNPLRTLEGIESFVLKSLDASDCNIEMLTTSTLDGLMDLYSLNLSRNSIMSIHMDTFINVPCLKDLDLSYNKLRGPLNTLMLEFNNRLETLSFRGNSEIKFMPGFKGQFPHLYNYDVSKCGLTGISNDTFKGMEYLVSLNLSGNSLVHIEPMTFSNLPNLIELDISNNFLHGLNSKLFQSNRELTKLCLSGNYFKHLSVSLFQPIPKLHSLDVSNCHLTSLWNISESFMMRRQNVLSKLTTLNLSRNNLTKMHTHYFISLVNLQKLDISNNPIECTPDFSHVMQWLIMKMVVPNKASTEKPIGLNIIENNVRWDEIMRAVCPLDLTKYMMDKVSAIPVRQAGHLINAFPAIERTEENLYENLGDFPPSRPTEEEFFYDPNLTELKNENERSAFSTDPPYLFQEVYDRDFTLQKLIMLFCIILVISLVIWKLQQVLREPHLRDRRSDGIPRYKKLDEECPELIHTQNSLGTISEKVGPDVWIL